jgi:ribosomal-protein-alanine N-acetyltransferase
MLPPCYDETVLNIQTERLLLRPLLLSDALDIQRLAGDREVAATTRDIEHPYEDGMAERWIDSCLRQGQSGELIHFAITVTTSQAFIGTATLHLDTDEKAAELSYWVGLAFWNQGFATEAAAAVVRHGFAEMKLDRVYAAHFTRNPASGRVLQKAGMLYEGSQLGPTVKWGIVENLELYGVTRAQFEVGSSTGSP